MTHPVRRPQPPERAFVRRAASLLFAGLAVVSLGACDSDTSADSADTATTDAPNGTADPADTGGSSSDISGPTATVPTDIPDELVGEIGALDVIGDVLPVYEDDIATDPAIGLAAPVLIGTGFDGNPVRVDAAADGPTMLVYLAHWCPHCNAEVRVINGLRDAGAFPEGLNIIAVSTAPSPDRANFPPSQWVDDMGWTYPVIVDGVDLAAGAYLGPTAYGLDGFPFVTLIDGDGTVAARWSGEAGADKIVERISTYLEM
ncbi:MAG TPA: TlpA disulfide reductase family protein [Ilumatobacter sp.]|nr:TlpA disulfide reductase family protein [Ilumatobacter sp.]